MREPAFKNRRNIAFFSADTKCKVLITYWGTRLSVAAVIRGKKVIVDLNEKFLVTDHDFRKLSIIPDAYLLHEIPEKDELTDALFVRERFTSEIVVFWSSLLNVQING